MSPERPANGRHGAMLAPMSTSRRYSPSSEHAAIAALATAQHGVVSRAQLRRAGFTTAGIDNGVQVRSAPARSSRGLRRGPPAALASGACDGRRAGLRSEGRAQPPVRRRPVADGASVAHAPRGQRAQRAPRPRRADASMPVTRGDARVRHPRHDAGPHAARPRRRRRRRHTHPRHQRGAARRPTPRGRVRRPDGAASPAPRAPARADRARRRGPHSRTSSCASCAATVCRFPRSTSTSPVTRSTCCGAASG